MRKILDFGTLQYLQVEADPETWHGVRSRNFLSLSSQNFRTIERFLNFNAGGCRKNWWSKMEGVSKKLVVKVKRDVTSMIMEVLKKR